MAAEDEAALGQALVHGSAALDTNHLAPVLIQLFGNVTVPQGKGIVPDLDDGGFQIKGQGIFDVVVAHHAIHRFVGDLGTAADAADDLVELHLVHKGIEAVESHQLAGLQFIHHQLAHIGVVAQEGAGIGQHDLLIDRPAFGHILIQGVQLPHAVILHHHTVGRVFADEVCQMSLRQVAFFFDHGNVHMLAGELGGLVLLHALFAQQQQGVFAGIEAGILQGLLNELGLAGL